MANSIFYSWQSDLPKNTNRNFIEDALEKAIKRLSTTVELEESMRDHPLELDKDTKGIPGIPPIADTIFKKISNSIVFVPDLSFVGETKDGRLLPNPNVLIEYGWALSILGHNRILPIMNTAHGEVSADTLPFDMRHLRHPYSYFLDSTSMASDKKAKKTALVEYLTKAIQLILDDIPAAIRIDHENYQQIPTSTSPSLFLKEDEPLGEIGGFHRAETTLVVPRNEHLFIRLIPSSKQPEIRNAKEANDLLSQARIKPLGESTGGWNNARNKHGAFVCCHENESVLSFAQLFKNRELWSVDCFSIDKKRQMEWAKSDFGFFPCVLLERVFLDAVSSYLPFCRDILNLPLPLRLIVGATGVEDYRMTPPTNMHFHGLEQFSGRCVENNVILEILLENYDVEPVSILRPFFESIWEHCGLNRPDKEKL